VPFANAKYSPVHISEQDCYRLPERVIYKSYPVCRPPARLREDYVPNGFKRYDGRDRSVPGHRYGLDLSVVDKHALIAFLKTL